MLFPSLHTPRYPQGSLGYKRRGKPLAGGWSAILFTLQGDMDYFASVLKLPKWQTKKKCCVLCQADAEGLNSWKNFDPSAPWVSTCWTPQSWHLFPGKSPCKLFSDIPGASAVMCSLDFMHNKYLGVDMYIFGSCLHLDTFQQCFAFGLLLPAFLHPWPMAPPCAHTHTITLVNSFEQTLWESILKAHFEVTFWESSLRGGFWESLCLMLLFWKPYCEDYVEQFFPLGRWFWHPKHNCVTSMKHTRYLLVYHMMSHGSPLENLKVLEAWVLEFYRQYPATSKFRHMSKLTMFMRKQGGPNWGVRLLKLEALGLWFCPYGKAIATAMSPCRRTSWSYWNWTRRWMQCLRSTRANFLSQSMLPKNSQKWFSTWATCSFF